MGSTGICNTKSCNIGLAINNVMYFLDKQKIADYFPAEMKLVRMVPLFKHNSRLKVSNYRPVSILSTTSKVFERLVFDQLEKYLTQHNLLYEFQSGFRAGYSTDTCLAHLCDYIRLESEKGNYTGTVLLDLQEAFDTVNPQHC